MIERFLWQGDPLAGVLAISFFLLGLLWARYRWRVTARRLRNLQQTRDGALKELGRLREERDAAKVVADAKAAKDAPTEAMTAFKRPVASPGPSDPAADMPATEMETVVAKAIEPPAEAKPISIQEADTIVEPPEDPEGGSATEAEPEPEPAEENEPAEEPETEPAPDREPEADAETEAEPDATEEPEPESVPDVEPETEVKTEADAEVPFEILRC